MPVQTEEVSTGDDGQGTMASVSPHGIYREKEALVGRLGILLLS